MLVDQRGGACPSFALDLRSLALPSFAHTFTRVIVKGGGQLRIVVRTNVKMKAYLVWYFQVTSERLYNKCRR